MKRWLRTMGTALQRLLPGLRSRPIPDIAATLAPSAMETVFTKIYRLNLWENAESRSGHGSTVARTPALRRALVGLCQDLGVKTLLDAPCGDFNWLKEARLPVTTYIGADVVRELIDQNRRRHAMPGREFRVLDITASALPRADLILCRDCLVHLPHADVFNALARFKGSGSRYLLTTTFPERVANEDIATGWWRPLNLEKAPFHLPAPLRVIIDDCQIHEYADKSLGLWRIDQLPG